MSYRIAYYHLRPLSSGLEGFDHAETEKQALTMARVKVRAGVEGAHARVEEEGTGEHVGTVVKSRGRVVLQRPKRARAKRAPKFDPVGKRAYTNERMGQYGPPLHSRGTIVGVSGDYYKVKFDYKPNADSSIRKDLMTITE